MAAVIYTNRANAQLQLGRAHAAGALADCERAAYLSPGYVKALHWKAKAQEALCAAAAEHVLRSNPAGWSLHSALDQQAVRLVGELCKSCCPTLRMRLLPCRLQRGLSPLQMYLSVDGLGQECCIGSGKHGKFHAGDGCPADMCSAAAAWGRTLSGNEGTNARWDSRTH